jgi:carbon-monoxide dehydrogenase medium subunit
MMAFRLATPAVLIDLNQVHALEHARLDGDVLVLGAMARHRAAQGLAPLRERCTAVAEGVDLVGHQAIRNRGTVGGSVAHADPAAEWPALLLLLDGEVDAVGPAGRRRTIPAGDLFETYFTTTLTPDEIVTEVRLPIPNGGAVGSAFVELARRHGDFAVAGAAALLALDEGGLVSDARVALIGVRDTAVRAGAAEAMLRGAAPSDEALEEASRAIDGDIDPVSDLHGSSEYRRRVAAVVTRRALTLARTRALAGLEAGGG